MRVRLTNIIIPLLRQSREILHAHLKSVDAVRRTGSRSQGILADAAVLHFHQFCQALLGERHRQHVVRDRAPHAQRFVQSPGRHERPFQLRPQFVRDVPERLQVVHVLLHARHVLLVVLVLGVDDAEHAQVQYVKELLHRLGEARASRGVIVLQLVEEVGEDVRVLQVDGAVRAREHVVQVELGLAHQFLEEVVEVARAHLQRGRHPRQGILHVLVQLLAGVAGEPFLAGPVAARVLAADCS